MPRIAYASRDMYGQALHVTFDREEHGLFLDKHLDAFGYRREISNYKDLVAAFLQKGTSRELFNGAWRRALQDGSLLYPKVLLRNLEQRMTEAEDDARTIDGYIGEMVNDPESRFYIYG